MRKKVKPPEEEEEGTGKQARSIRRGAYARARVGTTANQTCVVGRKLNLSWHRMQRSAQGATTAAAASNLFVLLLSS